MGLHLLRHLDSLLPNCAIEQAPSTLRPDSLFQDVAFAAILPSLALSIVASFSPDVPAVSPPACLLPTGRGGSFLMSIGCNVFPLHKTRLG
jgi:hypothetical protein